MKAKNAILALCIFVLEAALNVSCGYANGIFITPGAKAAGMGYAFTSIADDATAIYWNPAGLAAQKGTQAEASAFYMSDPTKSNKSLANAVAPNPANGDFPLPAVYNALGLGTIEPSFAKKTMSVDCFSPFVACISTYKGIVYAIGFYGIAGGGGKFSDTVADAMGGADRISGVVDAQQAISIYNVSAAMDVSEGLALGLGLDMVNMTDKLSVEKSYTINPGSMLTGTGLASYDINASNDASGSGIQFNVGAKYKVSENINAGLVFRTGTNIALKGKSTYIQSGLAAIGSPDANLSSNYNKDYAFPSTVDLGVSFQPQPKLIVAAGVGYDMYYSMKNDVTYANPVPGIFDNVDQSSHWKSVPLYRLGAQYLCNTNFSIRGGIETDPAPFAVDNMTFLNTNQFSMTYFLLGAGYSLGKVRLEGVYSYGMSDSPSSGDRTSQFNINVYRLDLQYNF
jgi:long-chain fatty acid transport protein